MDRRTPPLVTALLAATGCTAVVEDLPTRPAPINPVPIVVIVPAPSGGAITPAAKPTPAASPATPAPTPAATPTPPPAPAPAPSPAPTPGADRGAIDSIRVAFFGISCKGNGKTPPNNGRRELPLGCVGYVTATPKDKNNVDVPAKIHGPDVDWDLRAGAGAVEVLAPTFPNDFNKDLRGVRPGEFSLCATVKGVQGCLNGTVTP
jgi:hypothetical protein